MNTGKTGNNRETAKIAFLEARLEAAELRAQLAELQGGNTRSERPVHRDRKPPREEAAAAARTERTERAEKPKREFIPADPTKFLPDGIKDKVVFGQVMEFLVKGNHYRGNAVKLSAVKKAIGADEMDAVVFKNWLFRCHGDKLYVKDNKTREGFISTWVNIKFRPNDDSGDETDAEEGTGEA